MKEKNINEDNLKRFAVVDRESWDCTAVKWSDLPDEFVDRVPVDFIYDMSVVLESGNLDVDTFIYFQPIDTDQDMEDYIEIYDCTNLQSYIIPDLGVKLIIPD